MATMSINIDTDQIKEWRSIVTLIAFFLANIVVLFPFHIPIYVPVRFAQAVLNILAYLRVISPKKIGPKDASQTTPEDSSQAASQDITKDPSNAATQDSPRDILQDAQSPPQNSDPDSTKPSPQRSFSFGSKLTQDSDNRNGNFTRIREKLKRFKHNKFVCFDFPMNSVTAPLIADLFLLAILAIGREEVHDGTIGQNGIHPIDIMIFFLTLAYIAISIDASGLIRWLALRVLQWGGKFGHTLFFYLYAFFFCLGTFIGNDPIILSGTAFLAYMTRISRNIGQPTAWIFTQFAVANVASAILVSSNPTNLVLAGAFDIKFIEYTANMVVPVVITAIVLFPFLLYIIFTDKDLIPVNIELFKPPPETISSTPVNPNIPNRHGEARNEDNSEQGRKEQAERQLLLSAIEILNPWLDSRGAAFGAVIMSATLVTVLALNAASVKTKEDDHLQVFWVTLPAAFVMLCWDLGFGWLHRDETRRIAKEGREKVELRAAEQERKASSGQATQLFQEAEVEMETLPQNSAAEGPQILVEQADDVKNNDVEIAISPVSPGASTSALEDGASSHLMTPAAPPGSDTSGTLTAKSSPLLTSSGSTAVEERHQASSRPSTGISSVEVKGHESSPGNPNFGEAQGTSDGGPQDVEKQAENSREQEQNAESQDKTQPATLVSLSMDGFRWMQETFPTVMAIISHLPFALVPFAFAMFVLVQALVTKGWVPVFAYGWDHWVQKTGTIGAIGGMGFLSVILCNFAGTNIGTTILLSRVIQTWQAIHDHDPSLPRISDRTFWATVYSMALGVNYGAFSTAFSASLAGLLWRDILERKYIFVGRKEFARQNIPIIAIAMTVGCTVLVGEVYIMRKDTPYQRSTQS